jgi:tetratricopeptide (TPR) repeat protein
MQNSKHTFLVVYSYNTIDKYCMAYSNNYAYEDERFGAEVFRRMYNFKQVQQLNHQGIKALNNHQYEKALRYFEEALRANPGHTITLSNKAHALSYLGREEEALAYYDEALGINPKNIYALEGIGIILDRHAEYEKTLRYFNEALRIDPTNDVIRKHKWITEDHRRKSQASRSEGKGPWLTRTTYKHSLSRTYMKSLSFALILFLSYIIYYKNKCKDDLHR